MQLRFWGVRGSIPTPGEHTRRWGGNTACVEVRHGDAPPLVFDCGTGARALGMHLVSQPHRNLELMFSHLHMDHVFGFPFFAPLYTPGYRVRITVPAFSDVEAKDKLARYLNGIYHPTRLRDFPAEVVFEGLRPGRQVQRGIFTVGGVGLNHPGGAIGYRVNVDRQSLAYITDTAPFARPGEGVMVGLEPTPGERRMLDFLHGTELVAYDTMYSLDEYLEKMSWGHSYPEYAVALCRAAGVEHLVLFHHRPDATDEMLDELSAHWAEQSGPMRVSVAREGDVVNVEG